MPDPLKEPLDKLQPPVITGGGIARELPKPEIAAQPKPEVAAQPKPEDAAQPNPAIPPRLSPQLIKIGGMDDRPARIVDLYYKRQRYAIYRIDIQDRIVICFSDEPNEATKQIAAVAPLVPLRDRLQRLITDLPEMKAANQDLIAQALWLGLEGQLDAGRQTLEGAILDATEALQRRARVERISQAGVVAIFAAGLVWLGSYFWGTDPVTRHFLMATGAGAVGAILSIAIAIQTRTATLEVDWKTSAFDGGIRVLIGVISGAVLFLFLASGLLAQFQIGDAKISGSANISGMLALLIGFAAGFLERLVPDLLSKVDNKGQPVAAPGAGGAASPGGAQQQLAAGGSASAMAASQAVSSGGAPSSGAAQHPPVTAGSAGGGTATSTTAPAVPTGAPGAQNGGTNPQSGTSTASGGGGNKS